MTAVIQSPPHEIARQEKLAHLRARGACVGSSAATPGPGRRQRRRRAPGPSGPRVELQISGASRYAHTGVAAFGSAASSPLVKAISAGELEQKATTQQVKALAEEERAAHRR